jgi:hypothetical protein
MSPTTLEISMGLLGGKLLAGFVRSPAQPLPLLNSPRHPTCQLVVSELLMFWVSKWFLTKSTVQHGFVLPSWHPDGAGMSGLVTCQIPEATDSHPASVHEVSPDATIRAAAQSSLRPPPLTQFCAMVVQGTVDALGYSEQDAMSAADALVAMSA